ncbi:MAG: ABC transporter ATP-binding protein [Zhaonellaceae bacterium]|jgi:ABC-type uncharacterized transport system ATPase subunit|nr:ABC transporter ATP-binding protein [Clostridia bacterium]
MQKECLLETRNITKKFPGVLANDKICIEIKKGEIHTLLGENGAGKSTLMNILYGLYQPQEGQIFFDGREVKIESPHKALELGIGMIHQHFMLIPNLTVLENVILGLPSAKPPLLELDKVRSDVKAIFDKYKFEVDLDAKVRDISVGAQQRVEIVKALYRKVQLLILDEPTAVLTPQESTELFKILRSLKEDGNSIIFISHKIEEVMEISDRITILRDGKVVKTVMKTETTREDLARLMVGRPIAMKLEKPEAKPGEVLLELIDVNMIDAKGKQLLSDISLQVRAGEIVGVAGVDGNGQDELAFALSGLRKISSGSIKIKGQEIKEKNPKEIINMGLSHIPADRIKHGMVKEFTIAENLIVHKHNQKPISNWGVLNLRNIAYYAKKLISGYDIRTPGPSVLAANLSGGNQQKVVLAKEFDRTPEILVVVQPTRGLDIGAREYVHEELLRQRRRGVAILLISTDLEEVRALSDRLAVMYKGTIVGIVDPADTKVEKIGLMMAGIAS